MVPDAGALVRESWLALTLGAMGVVLIGEVLTRASARTAERCLAWRLVFAVLAALLAAESFGLNGATRAVARDLVRGPGGEGRRLAPMGSLPDGPPTLPPIDEERGREAPADFAIGWATMLGGAWALGTTMLLGRFVVGQVLLGRLRRRLRPVSAPGLQERGQRLARMLGLGRAPRMGESDTLDGPLVFGVLRPTLVLPADFAAMLTVPQQDAVLAHELRHVQAGDPRWRALADAVVAFLWWHPAAWWGRRRLLAAMETAADEASLVLDETGPLGLAEALLHFGRLRFAGHTAALAAWGLGPGATLAERVRALLDLRPAPVPAGRPRWRCFGMTVVLAVGGTALMAGMRPNQVREEVPMDHATKSLRNSLAGALLAFLVAPGPELASASLPNPTQDDPKPARRPVPATLAGDRSEAGSAEFVGLSPVQRKAFDELVRAKDKKNQEFYNRQPHDPAEGMVINKWWNDSLKELFSKEQYNRYVQYWGAGPRATSPRVAARVGPGGAAAAPGASGAAVAQRGAGGAPNFRGMEDDVLGQLGLSELQRDEIDKFYKENQKHLAEFREFSKSGDGPEIAKRAQALNQNLRSTMRRIMTKDQYAKYQALWDERLGITKPGQPAAKGARGLAVPVVPPPSGERPR